MTSGTLQPGGNPERAGGNIQTVGIQLGVSTVKDKLLTLYRGIGVKACDFMSEVKYTDTFNLLSDRGVFGEITRKAILKSVGSADLSAILPPRYKAARVVEEEVLISQVVSVYAQDNDFRSGVSSVKDMVLKLRPFIEGKLNFRSNSNSGFVVDSTSYSWSVLEGHLNRDPSGSLLVIYLGERMQSYGGRLSISSRVNGFKFGVDQFVTANVVFKEQKLPEIEQLLHAARFLKGIDAVIQKLGFGPSPFS